MINQDNRLYSLALLIAGIGLLFMAIRFVLGGVFITSVPGATAWLMVLHWVGIYSIPVMLLVLALVFFRLFLASFKHRLLMPTSPTARIGQGLAAIGVISFFLFLAWTGFVAFQGRDIRIFFSVTPVSFWPAFLFSGIALVESARVHQLSKALLLMFEASRNEERMRSE